jgi:hypothetical protein
VVKIEVEVFWVVIPCSVVVGCQKTLTFCCHCYWRSTWKLKCVVNVHDCSQSVMP